MKKTLIFILMILVLIVSSCNLFLKEEYGDLILSFDGTLPDGARALDSNGLPVLSSSPMKINIIREDGYTITRELSAEEPKSLVELVPVGEKIEIIVTAINPSGQWSGRAFHTVVSGQNHVRVLLNKNVSGLKNLLFTQTKTTDPHGSDIYNLTFYMGGKEVKAPYSKEEYSFERDSKGRLYVRYKPNDTCLVRYTSEGELNGPLDNQTTIEFLANDYTTGKIYGIEKNGSIYDVYEIDETLHLLYLVSLSSSNTPPFAVDNGIFTLADLASGKIHLWKAGMSFTAYGDFSTKVNEYHLSTNDGFAIKDIFIRNGYVYLLLAAVRDKDPRGLYSLGAVLKWKIGTDPSSDYPQFEGTPVVLGKSAGSLDFEKGLLKNYDYSKNFYGAVKVIGFDEENIYIADDGFDAADTPAGARIVKNRNRIATLNIATNALSFSDAGPAKWYNEWREWRTPNTKMIVWRQESYKYYYYQLDTCDEALTSNKKFTTDSSGYKDVFCYDLDGNLYIVDNNSKINMYPQTEGIYPNQPIKNTGLPSFKQEKGIAVDTSALDGYKYLYYVDNTDSIKRLKWEKGEFAYANTDLSFEIQNTSIQGEVSAMAANKDGLFVAVKENISGNKYKITVKKYDRSGSLSSGMDISEGNKGNHDNPIVEDVYAMQILDGRLYALSYKTVGAGKFPYFKGNDTRAVVSGKLLDLGLTSKNLSAQPQTLWSGTQEDKGYAPFRFIAIKPKELVIANDGFYGTEVSGAPSINQRNKVLKFSSSGSLLSEASTGASFSRELSHRGIGLGCGFIWY
ncbi:hypothetical protein E4N90_02815 [Treponema denticola]|uniref:hypothetical protein n=1 Tax=Treponema denticola TaxID=158 RepID=UPI0020A39BDF|nr:hypothetical protein [Treponema denticola]UTD06929.1 hypothetical protein E4N90_02815 [Treponema denticola]